MVTFLSILFCLLGIIQTIVMLWLSFSERRDDCE